MGFLLGVLLYGIWYLFLFYVLVTHFKQIVWGVVIVLILVGIAELLSPKS